MKKYYLLLSVCIIILIIGITLTGYAQSKSNPSMVVVNGLPIKKLMGDIEGCELINLPEEERFTYRLLITKKGNKYYWSSRENKELILSKNSNIYDFVEPEGRGSIRVTITEGKCLYMEHLTIEFKHITYWGIAEECNLK